MLEFVGPLCCSAPQRTLEAIQTMSDRETSSRPKHSDAETRPDHAHEAEHRGTTARVESEVLTQGSFVLEPGVDTSSFATAESSWYGGDHRSLYMSFTQGIDGQFKRMTVTSTPPPAPGGALSEAQVEELRGEIERVRVNPSQLASIFPCLRCCVRDPGAKLLGIDFFTSDLAGLCSVQLEKVEQQLTRESVWAISMIDWKDKHRKTTNDVVHWIVACIIYTLHAPPSAPLYSQVNVALRIAGGHTNETSMEKEKAKEIVDAVEPFITTLDEALSALPHQRIATFRGMRHVPRQKLGDEIIQDSYTSTSERRGVAEKFAGGNALYVIHSIRGGSLKFCSRYQSEAEVLLPRDLTFRVFARFSPTLQGVLRLPYRVYKLREKGTAITPEDAFNGAHALAPIFEQFLKEYVPARVREIGTATAAVTRPGDDTNVGGTPLNEVLDSWVRGIVKAKNDSTNSLPPHRGFVAEAGRGKTAAAVYANAFLTTPEFQAMKVLPIFIALPSVKHALKREAGYGALDRAVGAQLLCDLQTAAERYTVIVLLDSLDEVPLGEEEFVDLLDASRNPALARDCRVMLTCRDGHLRMNVAKIFGTSPAQLTILPLTPKDTIELVNRAVESSSEFAGWAEQIAKAPGSDIPNIVKLRIEKMKQHDEAACTSPIWALFYDYFERIVPKAALEASGKLAFEMMKLGGWIIQRSIFQDFWVESDK